MNPEDITDTVVVKRTAANKSGGKNLHVPNGGGIPICRMAKHHDESIWEEKPLSVYPEAWRDWCGHCLNSIEKS